MKTKFKSFFTIIIICIGLIFLLFSVSENISITHQDDVGTYQITGAGDSFYIFRLNTSTGHIVKIKKTDIKRLRISK